MKTRLSACLASLLTCCGAIIAATEIPISQLPEGRSFSSASNWMLMVTNITGTANFKTIKISPSNQLEGFKALANWPAGSSFYLTNMPDGTTLAPTTNWFLVGTQAAGAIVQTKMSPSNVLAALTNLSSWPTQWSGSFNGASTGSFYGSGLGAFGGSMSGSGFGLTNLIVPGRSNYIIVNAQHVYTDVSNAVRSLTNNSTVEIGPGHWDYAGVKGFANLNANAAIRLYKLTNIVIRGNHPVIHCTNYGSLVYATDCSNIVWQGIDFVGDRVDVTNYIATDFEIAGMHFNAGKNYNFTYEDCRFVDVPDQAIAFVGDFGTGAYGKNILVKNCYFKNLGQTNVTHLSLGHDGSCVAGAMDNVTVEGCFAEDVVHFFEVEAYQGGTSFRPKNFHVINNIVNRWYGYCALLVAGTSWTTAYSWENVNISHNTFVADPTWQSPTAFQCVYLLGPGTNIIIANNIFDGIDEYGIHVNVGAQTGPIKNVLISGNKFIDSVGHGGTANSWAITLPGTNHLGVQIHGNTFQTDGTRRLFGSHNFMSKMEWFDNQWNLLPGDIAPFIGMDGYDCYTNLLVRVSGTNTPTWTCSIGSTHINSGNGIMRWFNGSSWNSWLHIPTNGGVPTVAQVGTNNFIIGNSNGTLYVYYVDAVGLVTNQTLAPYVFRTGILNGLLGTDAAGLLMATNNYTYPTNPAVNGATVDLNRTYQFTNAAGDITFTGLLNVENSKVKTANLLIGANGADRVVTIPGQWMNHEDATAFVVTNTWFAEMTVKCYGNAWTSVVWLLIK